MSEATGGRREARKAQTRVEIRDVAQRLFAERGFDGVTSADVATAAGVAVQTVFNHFGSKEDLFFDGRTPWVEGLADAVTRRPAGVEPMAALRRYLDADLVALFAQDERPENRSYLEVLDRSPALQARELSLVELAAHRLADALQEAARSDGLDAADPVRAEALDRLAASLFLVAGRALVLEHRRLLLDPATDPADRASVRGLVTAVLTMLEEGLRGLAGEQPGRRD